MIQLPPVALATNATTELARLQMIVDSCVDYESQVREAKSRWKGKPVRTFQTVRQTLRRITGKSHRCNYCEDNEADEVEHIYPKTLYPERTFSWDNYLFACGRCNPEKSDQFTVFPDAGHTWVDVQRSGNSLIVPPTAGDLVLINPRLEDPLYFLFLEMKGGTFIFHADPRRTAREQARAKYTVTVLGLNTRSGLPRFRRDAYISYRARLREYIQDRDTGATPRQLRWLMGALKRLPHRTVWKEMQRQAARIPELASLFEAAPEALTW